MIVFTPECGMCSVSIAPPLPVSLPPRGYSGSSPQHGSLPPPAYSSHSNHSSHVSHTSLPREWPADANNFYNQSMYLPASGLSLCIYVFSLLNLECTHSLKFERFDWCSNSMIRSMTVLGILPSCNFISWALLGRQFIQFLCFQPYSAVLLLIK